MSALFFFWSGSFLRPLLLYADGLEDLHFSSGHSFHVFLPLSFDEGQSGFSDNFRFFYPLLCPHCNQGRDFFKPYKGQAEAKRQQNGLQ